MPTISNTYLSVEDRPKYSISGFECTVNPEKFPELLKNEPAEPIRAFIQNLNLGFYSQGELCNRINSDLDYYSLEDKCELITKDNTAYIKVPTTYSDIEKLKSIDKYREIFDSLKERFDTTKAILLANNICDRVQATKLQTVLAVLSSHGCLTHGASLIEMGRSLDELVRCELIPVINEIGFTNIRFTNKNGYLETTWVNSK